MTGCTLAEADEVRRALGSPDAPARGARRGSARTRSARGLPAAELVERVWEVLRGFASFGFCKAHAAAFALPTYQSAWLKAHHPAAFLAGVLTHDPGMYPKRLILDDARQLGISVLRARRQRLRRAVHGRAGRSLRRAAAGHPRRPAPAGARAGQRAAGRSGVRHPARAVGRQGDQRGRGRAGRGRAAVRDPLGLLAPRPGVPAGGRAARGGRGVRLPLRHRRPGPGAPARAGDPAGPAAAGGRPGPLGPARPARGTRRHRGARTGPTRADHGRPVDAGRRDRARRRPRQSQAPAAVRAPDVQLAFDLGPRTPRGTVRAAGDERGGAGQGRAGDPRPGRQPARPGLLRSRCSTSSG